MCPKEQEQEIKKPATPSTPGTSMLNKPLPQILDEMGDAIAAAAESARRAEIALQQARVAAKEAGDAATKAAHAAVEGARREMLDRISDLDKAVKQDRVAQAAVTKALQDENKQLRQDIADAEARVNTRIDRLIATIRNANQAKAEMYNHPKQGLGSI
jgi:hypothetical protein